MRKGIRLAIVAAALSIAVSGTPAMADDSGDVQAAISGQLQAFRSDDGTAAYSYAAPNIKAIFPSAQAFMSMVRSGYDPVYHSNAAVFGKLSPEGSGFRQEVYLTDSSGKNWIASYTLERQPDGSMKITGCAIRKSDDVSA